MPDFDETLPLPLDFTEDDDLSDLEESDGLFDDVDEDATSGERAEGEDLIGTEDEEYDEEWERLQEELEKEVGERGTKLDED